MVKTIVVFLAVSEKPGHDFPQRIIYHLEGDGSLHAHRRKKESEV